MALTAMAVASVAAPVVGGLIGNMASASDRGAARSAMNNALAAIENVGAGPDLSRKIFYEEFKKAGVLTPELEQAINLDTSKVSQIQEDPSLRQAQTQALQLLQQRGQTGLSIQDRAAFNQLQQEVATQNEGRRQQILQNMAQRGQSGSGAELLAELQNSQSGTNQASQNALNMSGQASQNALNAILQSGQLGGSIRSQDFSNAQAKAQAADELNRFNVGNQLGQQSRNVAAKNIAQSGNLSNAQNIMNMNTQQQNAEKLRQRDAEEQMYQNKLAQAGAMAQAYNNQSNYLTGAANQTANMWQGIGSGVGQGLGAMSGGGLGGGKPPTGGGGMGSKAV